MEYLRNDEFTITVLLRSTAIDTEQVCPVYRSTLVLFGLGSPLASKSYIVADNCHVVFTANYPACMSGHRTPGTKGAPGMESTQDSAEMLGHSTITQTMDTYSHVLPDMQDAAVVAMQDTLP